MSALEMRGGRKQRLGTLAVLVLAATCVASLLPASAFAAPKSVNGFIGGPFGGLGGQFAQPRDIAVYEGTDGDPSTDKIFVVEAISAAQRVQRLDADGNFERIWGRNVDASQAGTGFEVCLIASDCQWPSSGATGTAAGEFDSPTGIAVDQANGWVYVHDRGNRRIQKFDIDGNFLLMFGKGVNQGGGAPASPGDVCTATHLAAGDVCGGGAPGNASAQLGSTSTDVRAPAIDPATGDVFVADPANRRILQYQSDGAFLRGWGWDVDKTTIDNRFETCTTTCGAGVNSAPTNSNGAFASNNPLNVAIDSNGIVYASDNAPSSSTQRIARFSSTPAPAGPGDATSSLTTAIASPPLFSSGTTPTKGLEIDPDTDGAGPDEEHLLVLRDPATSSGGDTVVQEFDIPAAPTDPVGPGNLVDTHVFATSGSHNGLGVNAGTGSLYLAVSGLFQSAFPACGCTDSPSADIHGLIILSEASSPIDASVEPPADATSTSVELVGSIDPGAFVAYQFEISADGANWVDVGPQRYAGGSQPVEVSQLATGLDPNTSYRVRMVLRRVTSLTGAETFVTNEGLVLTDSVPPAVETLGSANRTDTSVQLRAKVDPNGAPTTYRFEYGPAGGSFAFQAPVPAAQAGAGNTATLVTQEVSGLVPDTAYQYRVVAANSTGTAIGATLGFATRPAGESRPPAGARAYELVSPPDKVSGAGVGRWGGGAAGAGAGSGFPAHVGERFSSQGDLGSVLLDGATAYATDWAFGARSPTGWTNHSPITHGATNQQSYRFLIVKSASEDLSKVTWSSNFSLLRPFPELAAWPDLYADFVGDWDGRWELVAPTDLDDQMHSFAISPIENGRLARSLLSADGSTVAFTTGLPSSGVQKSNPGGLAGEGDPTHPQWTELIAGRAAYLDDVSAGLSDEFEGNGVYSNVGVCAGDTLIPSQSGASLLEAQACAAPVGLPAGPDATLISSRGAALHSVNDTQITDNVVSRDGSRVFFMSPDPIASGVSAAGCTGTGAATLCPPQLYVRQRNVDGSVTTRWVSRAEDGLFGDQAASLTGTVRFAGASEDGDKVFFQTDSPLTADDPNAGCGESPPPCLTGTPSSSSSDLYVYDLPDGPDGDPATPDADPADGELTRVSAGPDGTGDCNVVSNVEHRSLRFASDAGDRVYFTCAAPLPGISPAANGTITEPGGTTSSTDATNLYVYDATEDTNAWAFVTRLPRGSGTDPVGPCATTNSRSKGGLLVHPNQATVSLLRMRLPQGHCVRGTADGEFVTFWTMGRLTLDDSDPATVDAYAYDAATDDLTRITAPQGGVGGSYLCDPYALTITGVNQGLVPSQCNGDNGFVNEGELELLGVASKPLVAGDRVAFFQSRSRLVVEDTDNAYDVYQWRNGELSLISTGDSKFDGAPGELGGAFYKGNDETGRNVYLATNDKLSWQDTDGVLDIYTARVDGGIPQPAAPVVCGVLVGGCQGGGAAATVPAPAATTEPSRAGGGNVAPGRRARLVVGGLGRRAGRRAARTGVLRFRVRSERAGVVRVLARARVGRRVRRVGGARERVQADNAARIGLRLSRPARRALRRGRVLRVRLRVAQAGGRTRTATVRLARGARS